ncbi:hypothetical protein ACN8ZM_39720 (plasmid) [Burkholderia aenigmatica]|uniref:hypothetical protein n=1 Tax=Burkholderia aenigmatica TaxID=2015348 RepID=UPI003B438604
MNSQSPIVGFDIGDFFIPGAAFLHFRFARYPLVTVIAELFAEEEPLMKPLSLDAQRNPDQHQYFVGFKNVCYLAGYIRRDNPHVVPDGATRRFWLQLTNNENLMVPVDLPPGIDLPKHAREFQGLKCICQLRGFRAEGDEQPRVSVIARGFGRINALEMPPLTAFEKAVPASAPNNTEFKPFGSGYRSNGASNKVEVAGIVSAKRFRHPTGEKSAALIMLIRQTANERQDIPVIFYGKLAEKLSEDIRVGAPIYATGRYRVTGIKVTDEINQSTGKPYVTGTPIIQIDVPTQPVERDILYIDGIRGGRLLWKERTPEWIFQVAPSPAAPRRAVVGDQQVATATIQKVEPNAEAVERQASPTLAPAMDGAGLSDEDLSSLGLSR